MRTEPHSKHAIVKLILNFDFKKLAHSDKNNSEYIQNEGNVGLRWVWFALHSFVLHSIFSRKIYEVFQNSEFLAHYAAEV